MARANWQCPSEWSEWSEWLAAGLHARNRWRLPVLLVGILFARGRRTVTAWLRAVGIRHDFADYFYFLAALGRKTESVSTQLLLLLLRTLPLPQRLLAVIDDSPTKRYGPKVEGADIHHNPTPGPAGQKYLYGHIWVTLSLALRHPLWGAMALPLRAMLYVRQKTIPTIPKKRGWKFHTKLELAARLLEWMATIVAKAGKTLWVVDTPNCRSCCGPWPPRWSSSAGSARTPRCATCLDHCGRASDAGVAVPASTGRTRSVWPNARDKNAAGKRSTVWSTAKRPPRPTRRSSPPIVPQGG
jgi:hypothetical protein